MFGKINFTYTEKVYLIDLMEKEITRLENIDIQKLADVYTKVEELRKLKQLTFKIKKIHPMK